MKRGGFLMNSPRFVIVVAMAALIGFASSSHAYGNDSYRNDLMQLDERSEIRSVMDEQEDNGDGEDDVKNLDIPSIKRFLNPAPGQVRTSLEFGGNNYYLLLVPPKETSDPIGVPAPEIRDNIGITGEEDIRINKSSLIMEKLETAIRGPSGN